MKCCKKCGKPLVNVPSYAVDEVEYCDRCGRKCEVPKAQLDAALEEKKPAGRLRGSKPVFDPSAHYQLPTARTPRMLRSVRKVVGVG
jgi:hypothetical protein